MMKFMMDDGIVTRNRHIKSMHDFYPLYLLSAGALVSPTGDVQKLRNFKDPVVLENKSHRFLNSESLVPTQMEVEQNIYVYILQFNLLCAMLQNKYHMRLMYFFNKL